MSKLSLCCRSPDKEDNREKFGFMYLWLQRKRDERIVQARAQEEKEKGLTFKPSINQKSLRLFKQVRFAVAQPIQFSEMPALVVYAQPRSPFPYLQVGRLCSSRASPCSNSES